MSVRLTTCAKNEPEKVAIDNTLPLEVARCGVAAKLNDIWGLSTHVWLILTKCHTMTVQWLPSPRLHSLDGAATLPFHKYHVWKLAIKTRLSFNQGHTTDEFIYFVMLIYPVFCSCDLDLNPMTLTHETSLGILRCISITKMKFPHQCFNSYSMNRTERQTDRCDIIWNHPLSSRLMVFPTFPELANTSLTLFEFNDISRFPGKCSSTSNVMDSLLQWFGHADRYSRTSLGSNFGPIPLLIFLTIHISLGRCSQCSSSVWGAPQ